MKDYGVFSKSISDLYDNLKEVRCVWADQTAQTYDHINDNMDAFAEYMWAYYVRAEKSADYIKSSYSESDYDNELMNLRSKVSSV